MPARSTDPTTALQAAAAKLPNVTVGTACNQNSYKVNNKSFLFVGPQGGRFKAMFKLDTSLAQASTLAKSQPDAFEVGKLNWVTARFTVDEPLPKSIWSKWLKESYELTCGGAKKGPKKKSSKKTATRSKTGKKKTTRTIRKAK